MRGSPDRSRSLKQSLCLADLHDTIDAKDAFCLPEAAVGDKVRNVAGRISRAAPFQPQGFHHPIGLGVPPGGVVAHDERGVGGDRLFDQGQDRF